MGKYELAETIINRQVGLQAERQKVEKIWKETAERLGPFGSILEGSMGNMSKMYSSRPLQDLPRQSAILYPTAAPEEELPLIRRLRGLGTANTRRANYGAV